jgi:hypothetical protein
MHEKSKMKALTTLLGPASLVALLGLFGGCKDDDPCDAGEVERYGQCYPAPSSSGGSAGSGAGGSAAGGMAGADSSDPGEGAAGAAAVDTPFGTECQDGAASSDCGGAAPVCADLSPLGQSQFCTQIDCAEGEANAGVCPEGFTCFAVSGYPSVCIKG